MTKEQRERLELVERHIEFYRERQGKTPELLLYQELLGLVKELMAEVANLKAERDSKKQPTEIKHYEYWSPS